MRFGVRAVGERTKMAVLRQGGHLSEAESLLAQAVE
jgi:hypothetical protein